MANDSYVDREPVVSSLTLGSGSLYPGTYTFGVWIQSVTNNNTRIVWSRTTDFTGGSTTAPGYVGVPAGYTDSGDPVIGENPQTYGSAPDRTFIAGLTFNRDSNGFGVGPSSVRVWGADNADFPYSPPNDAWSATGSEVASRPAFTTNQQLMLDKPWMDVSWYTPTQGYVYAVYTEENFLNRLTDRILFKESPNGVSARCRPREVAAWIHGLLSTLSPAVPVIRTLASLRSSSIRPAVMSTFYGWTHTTTTSR